MTKYPPPPQYGGYRPPPQYIPGQYIPPQQSTADRGGSSGSAGAGGGGALGTLAGAYSTWKMADPVLPYKYTTQGVWDSILGRPGPTGAGGAFEGVTGSMGSGYNPGAMSGSVSGVANGGYGGGAGGAFDGITGSMSGSNTATGAGGASTYGQVAQYAGGALGAYGLYDLYTNRAPNRTNGIVTGASSGAAVGTAIAPGIGTAIGAVAGGLFGAAMLPKNRTNLEQVRNYRLGKAGYKYLTNADMTDVKDPGFRQDLAADFQGYDKDGKYVNNKFTKSRKESDLTPETIMNRTQGVGQAGFVKEFGNAWMERLDDAGRKAIIQDAISRNLIREKMGSTFLNADPALVKKALYLMNGIKG